MWVGEFFVVEYVPAALLAMLTLGGWCGEESRCSLQCLVRFPTHMHSWWVGGNMLPIKRGALLAVAICWAACAERDSRLRCDFWGTRGHAARD
jgi:hypothetical protein